MALVFLRRRSPVSGRCFDGGPLKTSITNGGFTVAHLGESCARFRGYLERDCDGDTCFEESRISIPGEVARRSIRSRFLSVMALITTIIPTFRRPQLLRRAIQSSLAQSFTDLQVLVLDNASGDETAAVVTKLIKTDGRVKYHCHPENIGGGNNFQYGLQHVTTPFFSILSDDDILLPDFYVTAKQAFTAHPQASFVACCPFHMTPTR